MYEDDTDLERDLELALDLFDPVPDRLEAVAMETFDRRVDAELAELVFDSLTTAASARGSGQPRLLTFEAGPLSIDVEVTSRPSGTTPARRFVVRLEPAQRTEYQLWAGSEQLSGTSDDLGRFAVTVPGTGPFRLRCRPAGNPQARSVVTQWTTA
ncbi:hypothetical protein [Dactylosporangium sp. NPDC048998]|uniref:hypothetical protein n=1 Tax=Dactylosporangium sp. NPDC048998 TaxID=3363976 RepID=UPI003724BBB6